MTHASGMRAKDIAVSSLAAAGSAGAGAGGIYASGQSSTAGGKLGGEINPDNSPLNHVDGQSWPTTLLQVKDGVNTADGWAPNRNPDKWPDQKILTSACMSVKAKLTPSSTDVDISLMGRTEDNQVITVYTTLSDSEGALGAKHYIEYFEKADNTSNSKRILYSDYSVSTSTVVTLKLDDSSEVINIKSKYKQIQGIWYLQDGEENSPSDPISITLDGKSFSFLTKTWNSSDSSSGQINNWSNVSIPNNSPALLKIRTNKKWKWMRWDNEYFSQLKHCSLQNS